MSEDTGQQQRYCTNCGAEVRSGNAFCFSCGAPLTTGAQEPGPSHPEPTPSEEPSPFDNLLHRVGGIFGRAREGLEGTGTGRLPGGGVEWFRQLPTIPKLLIVGLVVGLVLLVLLVWLVLLAFLSPVVGIVFGSLFGVSIIALIIRVAQRRPIRNWAIVAVASVVLMFTFGGISDIVYGGGWGPSSGRGGSGEKVANNPSDGGGASPSTPAGGDYSSPSPSALSVGDEVEFTGEVFGMPEDITYDGRPLTGQVIDVGGEHMMVLADPMQGIIMTGFPGQKMRVHGEYQGPISGSGGGSYDAVLADKVEVLDDQ